MQVNSIPAKSILFGSHFKLVFLAGWTCWIAFGLLMLIVSLIAPSALTVNGEAAEGVGDGITAFILAIILGGILSALTSVIGCGLYKFIGKFINLGTVSYDSGESLDYNAP